jgi:hypothetical protein
MKVDPARLVVYIPDTRGVTVSRYGFGNLKIGPNCYTYSRMPGLPTQQALGMPLNGEYTPGTCPGASEECLAICYAARPVAEQGAVAAMWRQNTWHVDVPPIPEDAQFLRLHVSGDFDTVDYIEAWIARLTERPDVTCWVYTKSWRVPALLPGLERLRALPNVQVFASMDRSVKALPPAGWRRAWIDGDARLTPYLRHKDMPRFEGWRLQEAPGGSTSYVCPEQTGHKANCIDCGYCLKGQRGDVTFREH